MTCPFERAIEVYEKEHCSRTFVEDLESYLLHGYVFSTPGYFVMGRAVSVYADPSEIIDPDHVFPVDEHSCWHVALAAGVTPFASFLSLIPYQLPYVSWEKRNKLRIYRMDRVEQAILG